MACGSPRGAARLVADALKTVTNLKSGSRVLLRADSAFYGHPTMSAAIKGGADVSVTVRLDPRVKAAIASIPADTWQTIAYTDAVYDEEARRWVSRAKVAEVPFTAFSSKKKTDQVPDRLVVRRIPDLNPTRGQDTLFDTWRFHAFFTTSTLDTVAADKTPAGTRSSNKSTPTLNAPRWRTCHRGNFCANAARLVLAMMAFNLTRAAATLTGPTLAKATTATIRRKLINNPARIATPARRITLHLPADWPWQTDWTKLFIHVCEPPSPAPT